METLDLITLKADIATEVDRAIDRRFRIFGEPKSPNAFNFEPRNISDFAFVPTDGLTIDSFSETNVEIDSVRGELAGIMAEDTVSDGIEAGFEVESTDGGEYE